MGKRCYVQLAHPYDAKKHSVAGKFVSIKLDGERALWDGGISRGLYADEVPYSNTAKDKKRFYATGLWTRRGKVIHAPAWFLDKLPRAILDGELWLGNKGFQQLSSIVRNQSGTSSWANVKYCIFDAPPMETWLADGFIEDKPHFVKTLKGCVEWYQKRATIVNWISQSDGFRHRQSFLQQLKLQDPCILHPQVALPDGERPARIELDRRLDEVLLLGGEGLILKSPSCLWLPERVHDMLKYKPWLDMEAEVTGYTTGRETDDGSRLLGKMGALVCKIPAGTFKVSGFTDAERVLSEVGLQKLSATDWAIRNPDSELIPEYQNKLFPRGSMVTIKYRELTDSGLPKEGRYWRKFTP